MGKSRYGQWEPCESRGSSTVLREAPGEIPGAYSLADRLIKPRSRAKTLFGRETIRPACRTSWRVIGSSLVVSAGWVRINLLLVTGDTAERGCPHQRFVVCGVGLRIECRDILLGVADALFEYLTKIPLRVRRGQLGVFIQFAAGLPIAGFHLHVSHVEEEPFEVVRGDPCIPAHALDAFIGGLGHVLSVCSGLAVYFFADAYVEILPLPFKRLLVAIRVGWLAAHGVTGGK